MSRLGVADREGDITKVEGQDARLSGITLRSLLIALLGILIMSMINPGPMWYNTGPSMNIGGQVPAPQGILTALLLLLVNVVLKRVGLDRFRFKHFEILTIYSMLYAAGKVLAMAFHHSFPFSIMLLPRYVYLDESSEYASWLDRASSWVIPKSEDNAWSFHFGRSKVPWNEWVVPIIMWTLFVTALLFFLMCTATIIRRHWTDRERLRYPLAQVVVSMTSVPEGEGYFTEFWQNRLLWIGALIPILISGINGLADYFPVIPAIPMAIRFADYTSDEVFKQAWTAYPGFSAIISPLIIGIGYLISTQLSFSVWLFYLLLRGIAAPIYQASGHANLITTNGINHSVGGFIGIALVALWLTRWDVVNALKASVGLKLREDAQNSNEALSYPVAVWGWIFSMAFLVMFSTIFMFASPWFAIAYYLVFLAMGITVARIRAESGLPVAIGPHNIMLPFIAASNISPGSWWFYGMMYGPFSGGWFGPLVGGALESYKMADETNMRRSSMSGVFLVAVVAGVVFGFIFGLPLLYEKGAFNADIWPRSVGSYANIRAPKFAGYGSLLYTLGVGVGGTVLLSYLKTLFVWWPLDPLGYAIAGLDFGYYYGINMFIAWVIKSNIFRFGGNRVMKNAMPFFMGLIVGDILMSLVWTVITFVVG